MGDTMTETVRVRTATASDLAAAQRLLLSAGLPLDGLTDQFEDGYAVVEAGRTAVAGEPGPAVGAEETGTSLAGLAGVEIYGAHGLLRSVVVAEAWRGRGVGEALVRERLDWARQRGVRSVHLLTTTAPNWFVRFGFVPAVRDDVPASLQRSPEFSGACPASAELLVLHLQPLVSTCCTPAPQGAQPVQRIDVGDSAALKTEVRSKYGAAATQAAQGSAASCCGSGTEVWNPITADLYEEGETAGLPAAALLASLGCGNPTALAQLSAGETVLDLGSGGGIDVLLSARRVGPTGKAYGLDMTDEMLELARANQLRAGATNVEFLKGDIEHIPLPDASVDVIISNCVINLAADKGRVLREAFRVLKPGGRLAVSDVVARRAVPAEIRRSAELWMGCVAGALHEAEYARLMHEAGFDNVSLEPTRVYSADDMRHFLEGASLPVPAALDEYDGAFMSAFVRGARPAG
jgi:arsenite methyltransferase